MAKPAAAPRGAFSQPPVTEHSVVVRNGRAAGTPLGVFEKPARD
ncbi:MAG TPA: hypothetical protein VJR89_20820 [Polyangiales bacterium]|nr:hypothetical protein [Polyangiales bacterium]